MWGQALEKKEDWAGAAQTYQKGLDAFPQSRDLRDELTQCKKKLDKKH
jgi:hypothetical protein